MPNITGSTFPIVSWSNKSNGVFYFSNGGVCEVSGSGHNFGTLNFDASHSNKIYGNAKTVQPPTITLIPQIKF